MEASFTLNTGAKIPAIGFGTWEISPDSTAQEMVSHALRAGYRLIDTAKAYDNERGVGAAIAESGFSRSELFITTKLWNDDQGYETTISAFQDSLSRLGLDYLDLYLIHWPASLDRHASWEALEQLSHEKVARAIGVSNYTIDHLKELEQRSSIVPAVNQVEFHPFIYEQQKDLLSYCSEHGIIVQAYSPLSRIAKESLPALTHMAERLGRTVQQIVLRWCYQHGTVALPRSTSAEHLASNIDLFDFTLSDDDMNILNNVSDGRRVTWDPAGMGSVSTTT